MGGVFLIDLHHATERRPKCRPLAGPLEAFERAFPWFSLYFKAHCLLDTPWGGMVCPTPMAGAKQHVRNGRLNIVFPHPMTHCTECIGTQTIMVIVFLFVFSSDHSVCKHNRLTAVCAGVCMENLRSFQLQIWKSFPRQPSAVEVLLPDLWISKLRSFC